jgi:hypothetical protein
LVVTVRRHHHHRQIGPALLDLSEQIQSVHLGHVDVREDHDQRRLYPVAQQVQRLAARVGEMHHIGAVARLAAKLLAEQLGDIGLVIDNQDADAHMPSSPPRLLPPGTARKGRPSGGRNDERCNVIARSAATRQSR